MEFEQVSSQEALDRLIEAVNWEHAFFREIYLLSPSFVYPDGGCTYSADAKPNIAALLVTFDSNYPALEFRFTEVSCCQLSFVCDAKPEKLVRPALGDDLELHFGLGGLIRVRSIKYRVIPRESAYGNRIRYGKYWDELFV